MLYSSQRGIWLNILTYNKELMNRIYVYQLNNHLQRESVIDFANKNHVEVDYFRIKHKKRLCVRIPAGCLHSMFVLRFGDDCSLIDKTWEISHSH